MFRLFEVYFLRLFLEGVLASEYYCLCIASQLGEGENTFTIKTADIKLIKKKVLNKEKRSSADIHASAYTQQVPVGLLNLSLRLVDIIYIFTSSRI